MSDDAKLVVAVRAGDATSLGALYELYGDMVYGVAFRITGSDADAEDVLQDVFVGLPEALRSYQERGSLPSWIKRVAARMALMKLRSQRRLREEDIEAAGDLAGDSGSAGAAIVDRITARQAIERLPDSVRVVFMLKEVEGYSHAEIAEMLGISSGASAARLFRAWRLLGTNESGEETR